MSLLIIGGTGTLGRQIVLQALTKGYQVRCLVRNFRKAAFLKEWGVELVYGDLTKPETIPPCFKGITTVIDSSTSRINDPYPLKVVDRDGKLYLIEAAKTAKIKRFIFFSPKNTENDSLIPLMKLKLEIEKKLIDSKITFTIFRLTGFYQGLIEQYAIPILENLSIWVTNEVSSVSYMDTQDIANFCLRALQLPRTENQIFTLDGSKQWTSDEIINLCEQLAGQNAKIQKISLFLLKMVSYFFGFFEWGENISDRLAFSKLASINKNSLASTVEIYKLFKFDLSDTIQLDEYFLQYFIRLLKRLRDINFEDIQKQKNLVL